MIGHYVAEDDRATAIGNIMHKNLVKIGLAVLKI